ncbi:MAG: hypothetical protein CVT70_19420 [Alphaproteobacteria bacterium HGW-Alphaproteobacteria-1]|nr:MAG: hypothetical protein CVT70_19420 [Alphaproteobacteria bacterium HGW-Alphaproteobacteria-1]
MLHVLRGRVLAFGCGPHHPLVHFIFPLRRFPPCPRREARVQERGALRASSPDPPPNLGTRPGRKDRAGSSQRKESQIAKSFDLYQHVIDSIIFSIASGTPAWRKPWTGEKGSAPFPLRSNSEPYSGINVLMLWLAADAKGYLAPFWFTYRQAQEAGGNVRKGVDSGRGQDRITRP